MHRKRRLLGAGRKLYTTGLAQFPNEILVRVIKFAPLLSLRWASRHFLHLSRNYEIYKMEIQITTTDLPDVYINDQRLNHVSPYEILEAFPASYRTLSHLIVRNKGYDYDTLRYNQIQKLSLCPRLIPNLIIFELFSSEPENQYLHLASELSQCCGRLTTMRVDCSDCWLS